MALVGRLMGARCGNNFMFKGPLPIRIMSKSHGLEERVSGNTTYLQQNIFEAIILEDFK